MFDWRKREGEILVGLGVFLLTHQNSISPIWGEKKRENNSCI